MMYFHNKKYRTGFAEAIHIGKTGQEILVFYVRLADGMLHPALQIRRETRKELAKDLLEFRRARRRCGSSSYALFGGGHPVGTWRWLACHSGLIRDFAGYNKRGKIREINFKTMCIRKTLKYVE